MLLMMLLMMMKMVDVFHQDTVRSPSFVRCHCYDCWRYLVYVMLTPMVYPLLHQGERIHPRMTKVWGRVSEIMQSRPWKARPTIVPTHSRRHVYTLDVRRGRWQGGCYYYGQIPQRMCVVDNRNRPFEENENDISKSQKRTQHQLFIFILKLAHISDLLNTQN